MFIFNFSFPTFMFCVFLFHFRFSLDLEQICLNRSNSNAFGKIKGKLTKKLKYIQIYFDLRHTRL